MPRGEQQGWWSSNWPWVIGCGCLVLLMIPVGCVGLIWFGSQRLLDDTGLDQAIEIALQHPRVIEELGEPVTTGFQGFNTNIRFNDGERVIEADRSLSGPDGDGVLHVVVRSRGEQWEIDVLELEVDEGVIDLLADSPEEPDL